LTEGWAQLPAHLLRDPERKILRDRFAADTRRSLDQQIAKLRLDLDRKRLVGPLASTEPAATDKAVAALAAKADPRAIAALPAAEPPLSLPWKALTAPDRVGLPWKAADRADLALRSGAVYLVTGEVRSLGGLLSVRAELFSTLEQRVLAVWTGDLAPDEAPARMAEAWASFREALLGRPWAGLSVTAAGTGGRVRAAGLWHPLPWSADDLSPGPLELVVQAPGQADETRSLTLEAGRTLTLAVGAPAGTPERLVLETDPAGALLYLDSRYLGPSPQTIDRPLATSRVRAQAPGLATLAWEIGPKTESPSRRVLSPPVPPRSVLEAKDRFYWSVAGFGASLAASSFLGAWQGEQVELANAYAAAGATEGYQKAIDTYNKANLAYGSAVVLTCGVFVWMMVELADYLGAAESTLP